MPPKKSKAEKDLSGTTRKDRTVGKVGGIYDIEPEPYLKAEHMPYFIAILQHLKDNEAVQAIDRYLVSQCAWWLCFMRKSIDEVERYGSIQTFESGAIQVSPYVTNVEKAQKNFNDCCKQLGMSPEAREKLHTFQERPKQTDDPMLSLLNGSASVA